MKAKRILSVILACLMCISIFTMGASAADTNGWTDPEKKTEAHYLVPSVGKYLAHPGEMLMTKLILPQLLGDAKLDLLDGAYTDKNVNAALSSIATDLENTLTTAITPALGAAAPIILSKLGGKIPAGLIYYVFANDAPEKVSTYTTLAANIDKDVTWNVTDKASFIDALCVALRPAIAMSLGKGIVEKYDSDYAPGLAALGATNLSSKAELLVKLAISAPKVSQFNSPANMVPLFAPMVSGPSPNLAALTPVILDASEREAVDAITRAVLTPLLDGLDQFGSTDMMTLLFKNLSDLLYNSDAIDKMLATDFVSLLLSGLDFSADNGFKAFVEDALTDTLSDILGEDVDLDVAGLLQQITYAGDLVDGKVVADQSLIYNVLANFLYNNLEDAPALQLWDNMPAFLEPIVSYLFKGIIWLSIL